MEVKAKKQKKLTPKQIRFCHEWIVDYHLGNAVIRAGFSEKGASGSGRRMLDDDRVKNLIAELEKNKQETALVTPEFVIDGLKTVAKRCLQQVAVMEWDYENKQLRQQVDADGNNVWTFDASGANKAFELLGKHLGIFERDNNQKRRVINVNLIKANTINIQNNGPDQVEFSEEQQKILLNGASDGSEHSGGSIYPVL